MDGGFISILDEFLRGDSDISNLVNFKMENIIKSIRPLIASSLEDARKEENVTRVNEILKKQAALEEKMEHNKNTLLHVVAKEGAIVTAIRLLECGADVNAKNNMGKTPIFYAIQNSEEMVKVLLDQSKVNDWDLFRQALLYGTEEIVWLLIKKSLLEFQNDSLQGAVSTINDKFDEIKNTGILMNTFLQKEFLSQHMNECYPLLIFFAARIFRKDILRIILENCRKHILTINEMKIEDVVEALNVKGFLGITALHYAVRHQLLAVSRFLLEEGADPNCRSQNNFTPLHFASYLQHEEMCQLLLSFGASNTVILNESKVNDWNLFRQVLLHETEEIVWLLINKSLLEIPNDSLQDAISAINYNFEDIQNTRILINSFVQQEFHLQHMEESYALLIFFAARIFRKDILHSILEDCRKHLIRINQMEIEDVSYEPSSVETLNVKGFSGMTALHLAVSHQLVEVVRFLLEEGADPNCRTQNSFTPLHFAAYFRHEEMCQLLLSFGANVNPNFVGVGNPLNLVCGDYETRAVVRKETDYSTDRNKDLKRPRTTFNVDIMKLLLESGADPNSLSKQGLPALFDACKCGHEELKILSEYGANLNALDSDGNSILHCISLEITSGRIDFLLCYFLLEDGFNIDSRRYYFVDRSTFPLSTDMKMLNYFMSRRVDRYARNNHDETYITTTVRCSLITRISLSSYKDKDFSKLYVVGSRLLGYNLPTYKRLNVLFSCIALKENELSSFIQMYREEKSRYAESLDYFEELKLELAKLTTTTISENCKISYFDFLTKDFYSSVQIARNSDLREFLQSEKCKNEFPCYEFLLKFRFQMVQDLENFVEMSFNFISNYTNLPPELAEMIMSNLRAIDFQDFGKVLSNE